MAFEHETVLLRETIDGLNIKPNGMYVDCTLGGAGHARYLLDQLNADGRLFAFDQDLVAIQNAREVLHDALEDERVTLIHRNFRYIQEALSELNVTEVDGIYYDLGVSSPQFDDGERGFSYRYASRLDMRMDQTQALTAYDVVNTWSFHDLNRIIARYGEERFSKRIARAIEQTREEHPIETTTELAEIVKTAIPAATRRSGGHPAKRTFQAIRIAVNDELGAIEESIEQGLDLLKPGGRMSIISFHSLEDRLVKHIFQEKSSLPDLPPNLPIIPPELEPAYKLINSKPIIASSAELAENNRSRSAKLRIIERIK